MDSFFAVTAPGIEAFTAHELQTLELLPAIAPGAFYREESKRAKAVTGQEDKPGDLPSLAVESETGGIPFKGDLAALYRASLHLRTASRILARLGNFFRATSFPELQKRAARLPWERFLAPGQPVAMRVTCHKSKLYHSDAVMRNVLAGLEERLGQPSLLIRKDEQAGGHAPQQVVVRLSDDICTVSVDASGEMLHKRGYRQAVAKAPLRETLAAALLMASGWDKVGTLIDPFCGSGTIPIEAAWMALGIPPGVKRDFAFMHWPNYDEQLWRSIKGQTSPSANGSRPPILASDRDAGAIRMARENAGRAGVEDFIEFKCQAVSSILPPPAAGWVVTNPPYGLRIHEGHDLRDLYAQFGNVLRKQCPGWRVTVLCNDLVLLGQMRMDLDASLRFVNGGIPVRVGRGRVD